MNKRHRTALITWLAAYPTITVILAAMEPFLVWAPLPVRTFIVTVVMVPLLVYIALPFTSGLLDKASSYLSSGSPSSTAGSKS